MWIRAYAVGSTVGRVAPVRRSTPGGSGKTVTASATTTSAYAPPCVRAATSCPTARPVTPAPRARTRPEASKPGTKGRAGTR